MTSGLAFDYFFIVLSFTFFGMLTLYALRTYLFFKDSSLAHHLKIIALGLAIFSIAKLMAMLNYMFGAGYPYVVNILEILAAMAILFGIIDFRKEFLRFKWLKEIQDQIDAEKKRWKAAK
mgnify:CR=1 FL=1